MRLLTNFLLFQLAWFSSVLGAANSLPFVGPAIVLLVVAVHLWTAKRPAAELLLIVACGVIGAFFDTFLVLSGWVAYPSGTWLDGAAPYWIVTMWMSFATTLNVSLGWLQGRPISAAVIGLFAGPATYLAGAKLGGIQLVDQATALFALGLGWAVMLPVLLNLSKCLHTESSPASAEAGRA